jgi:glycosyltransferase involved in cell wall biosynthesis
MERIVEHVSVCVCTFKRPTILKRLLIELERQNTRNSFTYSIIVADNDKAQSAETVVTEFAAKSHVHTVYCLEPQQNIAMARNKALQYAEGDYVAFIDDDELPIRDWLLVLIQTCRKYDVDGVLGPVKPYFEEEPPEWVIKGRFYERPTYSTGLVIDWRKGRTGNVLLRKSVFDGLEYAFNPEFLTGEDQNFFMRTIDRGCVFVWCNEAIAYEIVPPIRWQRGFMLRRALLRGQIAIRHPISKKHELAKSLLAVGTYAMVLPVFLPCSHHLFMKYLVQMFDHLGKLSAFFGFNLIKDKYVVH